MAEVISTDVGSITIRQLHDFVHKEYAALEEQIIRKTNIDYMAPLEYIDKHSKEEYVGPDKSVPPEQRAKMDELKESAQNAVEQIKNMMALCEKRFNLKRFSGVRWLEPKRTTTTKHYLWGQLKNPDNMDSPISISIFVDKNSETLQPRYRISLEIKNEDADKALMKQYHGYLDMEPDAWHGLTYVCDSNESEYVIILKESHDTIKAQVEAGVYDKVQYCKMIDRNEAYSNEDYERQILEGVAALMPFYEHVVGISKPEYWPTKGEYDPGISVEMWKELLADPEVTLVENLQMFKMMLELGGEATCAKLAEVYGGSYASYNGLGRVFGERVYQKTNCPLCTDGDRKRRYTIPFVGREVVEDGKNRYSWKIREELQEALESMDLSEIDIEKNQKMNKAFPKNMILYGPPGTGKTYNTVKYAVAICEGKPLSEYDQMDYVDILRKYENYKAKGRIAFTTFHQSYGYEEFIEGIKPVLKSDDTKKESKDIQYDVIPGLFKSFCKNASMKSGIVEKEDEDQEPYVFIIDEINRGNISKIFGELITLIEETKRAGAAEAMETMLPYSGDTFSVPNNVYILGTMNTADRSIALMDTALRRRFDFEEMMPDSKVLLGVTIENNGESLDVARMLDVINERIEFLYDREHMIGHAFFTKLIDNPSFDVLADIIRSKVIPLLQEYFYEDYAKIQLVLGDNDKSDPKFKFILDEPVKAKSIFKGNPEDIVDLPEKKYVIQDEAFGYIQSYIEIK
ncbi:MAG: AAA family ATPase [Lachnospiraceae bacterium]|nr:AAA family ATPase [Lachnospiraceae bacterium]